MANATESTEVIPKFINLLQRDKALCIHGNGQNTRRYLYAGDAADAFDTILHKGEMGQIYNVDSRDEISNLELARRLCRDFGIEKLHKRIEYTRDRPFNDLRYAVDGSKLRQLGWKQRVSFDEGLAKTVEWYKQYGNWWGPIDNILTPFPEVSTARQSHGRGHGPSFATVDASFAPLDTMTKPPTPPYAVPDPVQQVCVGAMGPTS